MKDERLYLQHIIESYEYIKEYIAFGKEDFLKSHLLQNATIKVLANITESASNLKEETRLEYTQIPWATVKSFRNVLVHDYLGDLEYEEVWQIINESLPDLVDVARKILKEKYETEI
ncbi:MAG: HepT-like ribonuclease domain-containing protein [Pseudomonadota bacterium]